MTVSQLGDAVQVLLERKVEGIMTLSQMRELAGKLLADIERTQDRNRRARESHRRRRVADLQDRGIECSELHCCDLEVSL